MGRRERSVYTETSVVMHGPREHIFALGAAIEEWPRILPHYRAVTLTERTVRPDGTTHKVATMKAWRPLRFGKIPVGWKTSQESNPQTELLHFLHIGGFTKGMDVYWLLAAEGDATRVTITHDFTLGWPLVGEFVAHRIVGQFFVDAIARRTLNCIKAMVEAGDGKHDREGEMSALTPDTRDASSLSRTVGEGHGVGADRG
jgi:ribosome-associated toxin RatA of RatAB toxin-antitoxin module